MSIFNKLKSLFIVEDDEGDPRQSGDNHVGTKNEVSNTNVVISKEDSGKFVDILFKAIEDANLDGFDYLEFKQSINGLKKQDLAKDERQLFLTAFTLAKTMNVDKNSLIESANHYLKVLENENSNFNESLTNNAKVKLQEKTDILAKSEKTLEQDKVKLAQLQKRIQNNELKISKLHEELKSAANKVEKLKVGFSHALKSITDQIRKDKEKIEKYLN